ncbi:ABC transporter ATP-binding protein [Paenibacillus sp. HN-1]|uniref:ABC transporter ATP-binding protein n=1 Tax=Paenibacillus TaxID=44249 RepID=UPI001CA81300|nr:MULTISPECIES: ABC transporter ATP-binding protein [Paenibacillus]MBY9079338.1 ABC transporter ATP-binding protein [Paenibacillus sp. CGMCC 1.18879]MBY9087727.1 ABC transporter ATP-binding protein [Paenibacillus sinensis]
MEAIRTIGLCKKYGTKNVVDQVNLIVPKGAIYGFIGRNGSGKSTTQKMVCGLVRPSAGEIHLFGKPVEDTLVRSRIGTLIEQPGVYPSMSAYENLVLQGLSIGVDNPKKKAMESLEMVGLGKSAKKKAKNLSLGMKQRLGIAIAMLGNPDLLVLDEPINGLDPEGIMELRQVIATINQEYGITILISSHILGELSKIATHYGIIKEGQLIQQISAQELAENRRDYLYVKVADSSNAANLIHQKLQPEECELGPNGEIRIYGISDTASVNMLLSRNGIAVQEIYLHQQDLEEYFLNLMGGEYHA